MAAEARGIDRSIISQFVMAFFPSITGQHEDFNSIGCSVLADSLTLRREDILGLRTAGSDIIRFKSEKFPIHARLQDDMQEHK